MNGISKRAPRISVLVALLSLAGCSGIPLPDDKVDYAGVWEGDGMRLAITEGGHVDYEREEGSNHKSVSAPIKAFEGDDFVVGFLFLATTFVVEEPPHEKDGEWHMTVDGVDLTRRGDR